MQTTTIDRLALRHRGPVIRPGDADYDTARRVWNGMIDKRPALVARPLDAADVATAVRFADDHELPLAVRGGGHNVAGLATIDGGLVVDLSLMRGVTVDAGSRVARAQGGATIADLDAATQRHGLAAPMGVVSETGIAGLTLGGGYGWLRRKHGLAVDSLLSAQLVTAAGDVLEVTDDGEHAEVLWGLRGGGGNFGIVTRFDYRLYPVGPEVMFAGTMYPFEHAAQVIADWRDFMEAAPEEISSQAVIWSVPAVDGFPAGTHGRPIVAIVALHCGDPADGEQALQPLRELSEPLIDLSGRQPYTDVQQLYDPFLPAQQYHYYWKALELDRLDGDVIAAIVDHAATRPSPHTLIPIWHMGGAMSRVPADATAFGDRSAPYLLSLDSTWDDPAATDLNVEWTRRIWAEMHRYSSGGVYVNFAGLVEEGERLSQAAYGRNYRRLQRLKTRYDPENTFRLNANVPPSGRDD